MSGETERDGGEGREKVDQPNGAFLQHNQNPARGSQLPPLPLTVPLEERDILSYYAIILCNIMELLLNFVDTMTV